MRVALLSCGESLRETWRDDMASRYDAVIGVNEVARWHPVDWWCFTDVECFEWWEGLAREPYADPRLFLPQSGIDRLLAGDHVDRFSRHLFTPFGAAEFLSQPTAMWMTYSGPMGLVLAHHIGATHVETFGVDMAGERSFSGVTRERRDVVRWQQERRNWHDLVAWVGDRGVHVTRHLPENMLVAEVEAR